MASDDAQQEPWFLRSSVPVLFPTHELLDLSISQSEFNQRLIESIRSRQQADTQQGQEDMIVDTPDDGDDFTFVTDSTSLGVSDAMAGMEINTTARTTSETPSETPSEAPTEIAPASTSDESHPFVQGLVSYDPSQGPIDPLEDIEDTEDKENQMRTENNDIAFRSTKQSLLDLFFELEEVLSGPSLLALLNSAWAEDPTATLKIIFNARSIHLGKASRTSLYRCAGWLATYHPLTLATNLPWLARPLIDKKAPKDKTDANEEEDESLVYIEAEKDDENNVSRFDVKYGTAHGYWKDLLNILALAANGKLNVLADPRQVLNPPDMRKDISTKSVKKDEAKDKRHQLRDTRQARAIALFEDDDKPVYQALHLTIARLFAAQLKADLAVLRGNDTKAKRQISLCAKWAPSHDRFHDKHTLIVSSIAEMMHPIGEVNAGSGDMDRELYLRHARELYRKDVSALRAHLDIVERNLSANTIDKIKYERVPSIAMNNYAKIFAVKDTERFTKYIKGVAQGKVQISGATLLPSTLVKSIRDGLGEDFAEVTSAQRMGTNRKSAINAMTKELKAQVVNGQWKTLVQRIKDSGSLESSIAICDVSGSMWGPVFPDGTCPLDTSIGLSLLVAEVTKPPFGGHFITFSGVPTVERIDLSKPLREKVDQLGRAHFQLNTNFVAVFESLILPMAVKNKLKQEDMVKRVFVFSDMQFDQADLSARNHHALMSDDPNATAWSTSFEHIKGKYAEAGYEMPELVFWNLAGGRAGYQDGDGGDPTAPKPVTADQEHTSLVSGYSQGMLKVFLDNGTFEYSEEEEEEDPEPETIEGDEEDEDAVVVNAPPTKKAKKDPMTTLRKAIGHKAYDPLVVVD
ncbi:hypothetical protein F4780DRAFT_508436 [Xylariomycetidae sp. FL0641]|nr:hypothetical protein F4780DRAFT_508436 [Xylariomycetidae sp. FL0641]